MWLTLNISWAEMLRGQYILRWIGLVLQCCSEWPFWPTSSSCTGID